MRITVPGGLRVAVSAAVLALCVLMACGACALAAGPAVRGVGWAVHSFVSPTYLPPGGTGAIQIDVLNVGAAQSEGPITVTDTLPPGVTATKAGGMLASILGVVEPLSSEEEEEREILGHGARWHCAGVTVVTCTSNPVFLPSLPGPVYPNEEIEERLAITVAVEPGAAGTFSNRVAVEGGGAPDVTRVSDPVTVSSSEPGFGFTGWDVSFTNADGTPATQAGSHPYEMTVFLGLNELANGRIAGEEVRNVEVDLPPGLFGDPGAVPQCTRGQLDAGACPRQTQVGDDMAGASNEGGGGTLSDYTVAVYNMVPPRGVPAEFAFSAAGLHTFLDARARSGGGYGLTERIDNIPQIRLDRNILTLWGVPADPSHDALRGSFGKCAVGEVCTSGILPKPLLTLPTSCAGPQAFTLRGTATWTDPNAHAEATVLTHDSGGTPTGFTGCEQLAFDPLLSAIPDTSFTDTPAGLNVGVKIPQETLKLPGSLVEGTLKNAVVGLPEGLVVNPGRATGLVACQPAEANLQGEGPASCPAASRIGTVKAGSPLLEGELESELEGGVYILQSNPPNVQILLALSGDGLDFKIVGNVHLDEATGRATATFAENPELPVSDISVSFDGGAQAALITPRACGTYTTNGDFTPWSTPFAPDASLTAQFALSGGVGGGSCPAGEPFAPSMTAGTLNPQAGAFSPLSVTLNRQDSEQDVSSLSVTAPPGLLALLKSVERCPEPQAGQGTCGAGSLIGHTTVAVGAGPNPLYVQGGQVFLTGPYKGAPFGLSVVVPAVAGPFNLGNVIVRAAIGIDAHTAQPTISSDPFPTILDGVPLQVKLVNVTVDRPGFMFNPTNCEPLTVSGSVTSTHGASAPLSSRFQAANCAALAFKPSFTVSTQAKTSKKSGASLDVKVGYPQGAQANIRSVAVSLPKQLPSRLTTIQQACPAATFAANPASCPAGSNIGTATATTPVLAAPVTGPAYLVSHGGAAFPDLVVVLQGEGVTLELVGSIDIKKGVTSSTFASVPDAPIGAFELQLPEGPHSGLAAVLPGKAKGNMCGQKLTMPTTLTGQNGAVVKQSTKIKVTGCATSKKRTKRKHPSTSRKHGKR